jgi:spermidine/putrescine-binding protein
MKTLFHFFIPVLLVLGLLSNGSAAAKTKLRVADWDYYDDPLLWQNFADTLKNTHKDVEVEIKPTFDSDSLIYAAIEGAPKGHYDVVHPYTSWLQVYVDKGLVIPIDTHKLTNWKYVPDRLKAIGRCGDSKYELRCSPKGTQYFIPWDIGFSSILYRTDKVEKVRSWDRLLRGDKDLRKRMSMFNDGPSAVAVSSYIHKYDETKITPEQLNKIQNEWVRQKSLYLNYWKTETPLVQDMTDDRVWIAYAWPSAYDAVKKGLKEKVEAGKIEKSADVAFAFGDQDAGADPMEKRASWVGVYGIVAGTNNLELAYEFINDKLAYETSMNLVDNFHYAVAQQDVMSKIIDPTVKELFPSDIASELFDKSNFTPELTYQQHSDWPRMWDNVKAGVLADDQK